jgi:hypothetical protein
MQTEVRERQNMMMWITFKESHGTVGVILRFPTLTSLVAKPFAALQNFPKVSFLISARAKPWWSQCNFSCASHQNAPSPGDIEPLKPNFKMAVSVAKEEMDYTIKPEAGASNISTEEWPLLLKNYDKRT